MKKSTYVTTRFDVDDNFFVEVIQNGVTVDFILCKKDATVKTFMFGLSPEHCPPETWEQLIVNNVNDYIPLFEKYEH